MTILNSKVLIDSNILINATNTHSKKHKVALAFLNQTPQGCISVQNINEFLRVSTHPIFQTPLTKAQAITQIKNFMCSFKVITPSEQTTLIHLDLLTKYNSTSNQIYGNFLVATMLTHDIKTIATDNENDFKKYKEIKVYNPFK
ncbi:MAG: PIN domain-containing protein [bacterium]|nr:PIN domain-containing protein [bacterium]